MYDYSIERPVEEQDNVECEIRSWKGAMNTVKNIVTDGPSHLDD
jgi:hypothetical protein